MSYRDKNGTWIIPEDQAKEFMSTTIDYDSLIMECLSLKEQDLIKEALRVFKRSKPFTEREVPKPLHFK
jgi:hypothetical protein